VRDRSPERHAVHDANAVASLLHVTDEGQRRAERRRALTAAALLGALALVWILGTAPSGGPDEPSHLVRAAALVRGDLDGDRFPGQGRVFELPAWVGHPATTCFELNEQQPASCATATTPPEGESFLVTSSTRYPIWGHIAPGLGTYYPGPSGNQLARVFDAAIPIGLLVAGLALAARRGRLALGASALAITPMAWFSIIVVNPSGLVIAGGFALWAGLLSAHRFSRDRQDRLMSWTLAAGWAAAVLPRRDGMIWAAVIVAICAAAGLVDLRGLVRRLGIGPLLLIAASTLVTLGWAATSDTVSAKFLFAAPLLPLIGAAIHHLWVTRPSVSQRVLLGSSVVVVGGAAAGLVMSRRRGGFDGDLLQRIIGQSGLNLEEAIGLLGWLDSPLPRTALFLWILALGMLAGAALMTKRGSAVGVATAIVGLGIVAAWVLEMSQGSNTSTYWQGRYFLPLLIGVPMVLGWSNARDGSDRTDDNEAEQNVFVAVVAAAAVVMTMAFGASMRRWGVGTAGSILPWKWDTYGTPVPPWALLVAHVAVCAGLIRLALTSTTTDQNESVDLDTLPAHDH